MAMPRTSDPLLMFLCFTWGCLMGLLPLIALTLDSMSPHDLWNNSCCSAQPVF